MWTTVYDSRTIELTLPDVAPAPLKIRQNSNVELGFDCAFAKNDQKRKHARVVTASIKSSLR
jgi:hypothetical protein